MIDYNVIQAELNLYEADYVSSLPEAVADLIYKPGGTNLYRGLLNALRTVLYKHFAPVTKKRANSKSPLTTADPDALYMLYDYYKSIAYKYNKTVMIEDYSIFTGIALDTFITWYKANNTIDININGITQRHTSLVRYIMNEQKSNIYSNIVQSNSVGSISYSKAIYGYNETDKKADNSPVVIALPADHIAERIAALGGPDGQKMLDKKDRKKA